MRKRSSNNKNRFVLGLSRAAHLAKGGMPLPIHFDVAAKSNRMLHYTLISADITADLFQRMIDPSVITPETAILRGWNVVTRDKSIKAHFTVP